MQGMDANTGKPLGGLGHLRQSVRDILATRRGTRIMRPEYGSDLPDLIDAPMNRATLVAIYAAAVAALSRWEPRVSVEAVTATAARPGAIELTVSGKYLPDGSAFALDGVVIS